MRFVVWAVMTFFSVCPPVSSSQLREEINNRNIKIKHISEEGREIFSFSSKGKELFSICSETTEYLVKVGRAAAEEKPVLAAHQTFIRKQIWAEKKKIRQEKELLGFGIERYKQQEDAGGRIDRFKTLQAEFFQQKLLTNKQEKEKMKAFVDELAERDPILPQTMRSFITGHMGGLETFCKEIEGHESKKIFSEFIVFCKAVNKNIKPLK